MTPPSAATEKSNQLLMKKYACLLISLIVLIILLTIAFILGMRFSGSRITIAEANSSTTFPPYVFDPHSSSEEVNSSDETVSPTIAQGRIEIEEPCPERYHYFAPTRSCYFISRQRVKISEAKFLCSVDDAKLTSIHSDEENLFLEDIERKKWGIVGIWLGLEKVQGQWRNHDSTPVDYLNFDHGTEEGDCVMMLGRAFNDSQSLRNWSKRDCNTEKRFSCKKPSYRRSEDEKLIKLKSKGIEQGSCERGWYFFDKTRACYSIKKNANFSDAQKGCEKENSALASIHSDEENQFILDIADFRSYYESNEIWIGLRRKDRTSINLDGTAMDYSNWAYENFFTFGECAQIYGQTYAAQYGEWNMFSCEYPQRYVCKKRFDF